MLNKIMTNLKNRSQSTPDSTAVAIEYMGHKWVISVRNPGQKNWVAHRSSDRKVQVYNHLNEVIKSIPAIETFATKQVAVDFLNRTFPNYHVEVRSARDIEEFFTGLRGAVQ